MLTLKLVVRAPKNIAADSKELTVKWPALPLKGHSIDLAPKGYTGFLVKVVDVTHWLGCDDIDIYCEIPNQSDAVENFNSLSKENGWKW